MAKTHEVPAIIRPFNKIFERLAYRHQASDVFSDFLDYTIYVFDTSREESQIEYIRKKYGNQYNDMVELWHEFIKCMAAGLDVDPWYDLLGTYYEIITSRWKSSAMGQFFTPATVCDFMTEIIHGNGVKGARATDPACGSGRTLLSFHVKNPGNLIYANDLDPICAKMCTVNFLVHGVVGQVVCSNSLDPSDYRWGFDVNPSLYPGGLVSVRRIEKEQSVVYQHWELTRQEFEKKQQEHPIEPTPAPQKRVPNVGTPSQLTLF